MHDIATRGFTKLFDDGHIIRYHTTVPIGPSECMQQRCTLSSVGVLLARDASIPHSTDLDLFGILQDGEPESTSPDPAVSIVFPSGPIATHQHPTIINRLQLPFLNNEYSILPSPKCCILKGKWAGRGRKVRNPSEPKRRLLIGFLEGQVH